MCSTVITLHICKFIFSVTFHVNMGKNCLVVPSYCTVIGWPRMRVTSLVYFVQCGSQHILQDFPCNKGRNRKLP